MSAAESLNLSSTLWNYERDTLEHERDLFKKGYVVDTELICSKNLGALLYITLSLTYLKHEPQRTPKNAEPFWLYLHVNIDYIKERREIPRESSNLDAAAAQSVLFFMCRAQLL